MIEKILNRFGYEKVQYTKVENIDQRDIDEMKDALKLVPHFDKYLEGIMESDVVRAYSCNEDERKIIRGARSRTNYILSLLKDETKKSKIPFVNRYF